jgi:hypothetical protein
MPDPNSLITAAEAQMELGMSSGDMPAGLFFEECEVKPRYTAERFFRKKPEAYRQVVALRAEGLGILRISKILSVHPYTVMAVLEREPTKIEMEKERLSRAARGAANLAVDGIIEDLADENTRRKVSARDKAIIAGVMIEKSELLVGRPTSINLNVDVVLPSHDEYNRLAMGCGGKPAGQKGEGQVGPESIDVDGKDLGVDDRGPGLRVQDAGEPAAAAGATGGTGTTTAPPPRPIKGGTPDAVSDAQ